MTTTHKRLFNAGLYTSAFHYNGAVFEKLSDAEKDMRRTNKNFLESYHYINDRMTKQMRSDGVKIFIDSGAYTAATKGSPIDLRKYINYCKQNADILEMISVLDEIPVAGSRGLTPEILAQAAEVTWRNLKVMEDAGLPPIIPTFHMGEPEAFLARYVEQYNYISLGGLVGASTRQLELWLDRIWGTYLTHPDGTPRIRVHGFGITSLPLMTKYPWASIDSSTWVQWAASGMILLPEQHAGQLNISSRSSFRKMQDQHLTTFAEPIEIVYQHEIERLGGDVQRLADFYYSRWAWNVWAFPHYLDSRGGGARSFVRSWVGLFD